MSILENIRKLSQTTENHYIQSAKENKRPVSGYFCAYVPEELIHAAGAIPYRMNAVESNGTSLGDQWFSSANCSFVRRVMDKGLEGRFNFLDSIIFMNGCDHNRRLYDNWRFSGTGNGNNYILFVPHSHSEASVNQYKIELEKLKKFLESHYSTQISDDKLRASITLLNKKRTLLSELAAFRKSEKIVLSGTEFLSIMLTVTTIPPEDAVILLEQVISEVKTREPLAQKAAIRLFVTGNCVEELSHLELIETNGAWIVEDSLCMGRRYYDRQIQADGDLIDNLAKGYLNSLSCPRMMDDFHARTDHIREAVKEYKADAVIIEKLEFCSMMTGESWISSQELKKYEIPHIILTRELYGGGTGQLKTRIQAFYEKVLHSS